jgi:hypothetical protein
MIRHSIGAFASLRMPGGRLIVARKTVTGFTNGEKEEVE